MKIFDTEGLIDYVAGVERASSKPEAKVKQVVARSTAWQLRCGLPGITLLPRSGHRNRLLEFWSSARPGG
jgi:hypothetical protein